MKPGIPELSNLAIRMLVKDLFHCGAVVPQPGYTTSEVIEYIERFCHAMIPALLLRAQQERLYGPDPKRCVQTAAEAEINLRRILSLIGLSDRLLDERKSQIRAYAALMMVLEPELLIVAHGIIELVESPPPEGFELAVALGRALTPPARDLG